MPNADVSLIQEKIAAAPKYDVSKRKGTKYTAELDAFIDEILENETLKGKRQITWCL